MNDKTKFILSIFIGSFSVIMLIGCFMLFYNSKKSEYESVISQLSRDNTYLNNKYEELATTYSSLTESNRRASELIGSTGFVLRELTESMEYTGTTIKDIREQQYRIRESVINLIRNYNEIADTLDGITDYN